MSDRRVKGASTDHDRRRFLRHLASLAVMETACGSARSSPRSALLSFPLAVTEPRHDSAIVWARTNGSREVRLAYARLHEPIAWKMTDIRTTRADDDFCAAFRLDGLRPGTRYTARLTDRGGSQHTAPVTFKTAPTTSDRLRFTWGADLLASYRPFKIFRTMAEASPDFFLLLGDTIYADRPADKAAVSLAEFRAKHRQVREDLSLTSFLAATPTIATWDDHDIDQNADRTSLKLGVARRALLEYWPMRTSDTDGTGLYRSFSWSPLADFFVCDCRSFRDPRVGPERGPSHLGRRQLTRLKDELAASSAPFKFLVSSVSFLDPFGLDSWRAYPREREELRRFIRYERIRTVVVLSADLHLGWDLEDRRSGLREFVAGPCAAWPFVEFGRERIAKVRALGRFHLMNRLNFGLVDVTDRNGIPTATVAFVDDRGRRHNVVEIRSPA